MESPKKVKVSKKEIYCVAHKYQFKNPITDVNDIQKAEILGKIPIKLKQESSKDQIIRLFRQNVENVSINISHEHWLENQMGIKHNNKNAPDINGYEMKKSSKKITIGDFSACEYLFKSHIKISELNGWKNANKITMTRSEFIQTFGTPKNNRYSWSGQCIPNYGDWNQCGQMMIFDSDNNLCIYYSYQRDLRESKVSFPEYLKHKMVVIALWTSHRLAQLINNKYNKNGFFICKKKDNKYQSISFGKPFDFEHFMVNIKNGLIIFDSGMYEGNNRNYSQFRSASKEFWNQLVVEEYS